MSSNADEYGDFSMLDLFREEAENHSNTIKTCLAGLEDQPSPRDLEPLILAAHSIKGAARIVGLSSAADLAHAMEEVLSKVQKGGFLLTSAHIQLLLSGCEIFAHAAGVSAAQVEDWLATQSGELTHIIACLRESIAVQHKPIAPAKVVDQPAESRPGTDESSCAPGDLSMLDLFRLEAENQARVLEAGLLGLEQDLSAERIEPLMRAAHSMKGAARIVGLMSVVTLAHAMEDVLSSAQDGRLILTSDEIDILLAGNDIFSRIADLGGHQLADWLQGESAAIDNLSNDLRRILPGKSQTSAESEKNYVSVQGRPQSKTVEDQEGQGTIVRITAENLSRLMGLAGESLIEVRSLDAFTRALLEIKAQHYELSASLENLRFSLPAGSAQVPYLAAVNSALDVMRRTHKMINDYMDGFELFSRRLEHLADGLYNEAIASRMRPFSDGTHGFSRMIRDLAKSLGKTVDFEILGDSTKVDRDILEKLEAPLTHLLRNSVDHGLETPEVRLAAGKPAQGSLILEARHWAGMLSITVADDGCGIEPGVIKQKIVEKGLGTEEMVSHLRPSELMEFLFLPGFTTTGSVTEISGRGVGLDVVRTIMHEVGGSVRCDSIPGQGARFHLQLPLSLSVVRTILVEIAGEPYAIPLTRIDRILSVERKAVQLIENRQYCSFDGINLGLVDAHQVLHLPGSAEPEEQICVVVVSDRMNCFGLAVHRFLGERDLVVKPLNPTLGKVPNISAAAILEDGSPVLILDVDDVVRSIDHILMRGRLEKVGISSRTALPRAQKRILVVDDSLTVREVERRLLENKGYEVEIAVDGMDGWNKVRTASFDLVISDVDMPRMNGIDFVALIKSDPGLKSMPVMIVSYKDRQEDRLRGLDAGANYYLTKSSFHDESLIKAVIDLIGEP